MAYEESLEWPIYRMVDGKEVETVFDITVSITPGTPDITSGPPDNWEQGTGPECEILSIHLGKAEIPYAEWAAYGFDDAELEKVEEAAFNLEPDEPDYERDED